MSYPDNITNFPNGLSVKKSFVELVSPNGLVSVKLTIDNNGNLVITKQDGTAGGIAVGNITNVATRSIANPKQNPIIFQSPINMKDENVYYFDTSLTNVKYGFLSSNGAGEEAAGADFAAVKISINASHRACLGEVDSFKPID